MRHVLAVVALALVVPSAAASPPAHAWWRWPVRGEVVGAFNYAPHAPFAAGQRRGIDIAAAPGVRVGSACAGAVTFAGRSPAGGLGVTVRCGALAATHLGLGTLAVGRGTRVAAGATLGRAGAAGRVRLGARVAGRRFAYVDPRTLLAGEPAGGRPLGPAPDPVVATPRRIHAPSPRPRLAGDHRVRVPVLAWLGIALLATGVGTGGILRRRRARHERAWRAEPHAGRR